MFDRLDKGLWWDRSWPVVRGCTKVSPGCAHCWSESEANVRGSNPAVAYRYDKANVLTEGRWNGRVSFAPERVLTEPLRTKKPSVWAVWNDLFHRKVYQEEIDRAMAVIALCPQHFFLCLTKRPETMDAYFSHTTGIGNVLSRVIRAAQNTEKPKNWRGGHSPGWPYRNLGLGVTVESPHYKERIDVIRKTPASLRFISFEPLVSDVGRVELSGFGWLIIGGLTLRGGRVQPPKREWVDSLVEQADAAGVPVFIKDNARYPVVRREVPAP